jgi:hypothetical protein
MHEKIFLFLNLYAFYTSVGLYRIALPRSRRSMGQRWKPDFAGLFLFVLAACGTAGQFLFVFAPDLAPAPAPEPKPESRNRIGTDR